MTSNEKPNSIRTGGDMLKKTREALDDLLSLAFVLLYPVILILMIYLIARIEEWSPWLGWWLRSTITSP
jgi:hypothetical protein